MIFVPRHRYIVNWPVMVGEHDVTDICRGDARVLGLLAEHLLLKIFDNLSSVPGRERPGDLLENYCDGTKVWEVKTTKDKSINIQPSREKGSGRKHDPERFANVLSSLSGGFIFVDLRKLPEVSFCGVPVSDLRVDESGIATKTQRTELIFDYDEITAEG